MVKQFQKEVSYKLTKYFSQKFYSLKEQDLSKFKHLAKEYNKQYDIIKNQQDVCTKYFKRGIHEEVLLNCLSEPITKYTYNRNFIQKRIYSPRLDIAISPVISKSRGKSVSMGIYNLSSDVNLFTQLHKLSFVRELEKRLRRISCQNYSSFDLIAKKYDYDIYRECQYMNKRPLHLFGIEIENQKNSKHLMGDFLNAISLSKVPIVLVPEGRLGNLQDMLCYSFIIFDIKEVEIYNILSETIILTISQFRDIVNSVLADEGMEPIVITEYR